MIDQLRTLIETTLADAGGLCLDDPDDCEALVDMLLGRLRITPPSAGIVPVYEPDDTDTGARLEREYHLRAADERADAAEWANHELRTALEALLNEDGIERQRCPRCNASYSAHPVRHAAGCPVQKAEDALKDTASGSEAARHEAADERANAVAERRSANLEVALRSLIYGANWLYSDAELAVRELEGSTNDLAYVRSELVTALSDLKGRIVFAQQTLRGRDALAALEGGGDE